VEKKLHTLLELSEAVVRENEPGKILYTINNITKELLDCDRSSIFLHDSEKRELWTIVAHGVEEIRIPENRGIVGHVFTTAEPINITDAYHDKRFDPTTDRRTGYKTRTMLTIPLIDHNERCIGVFQVINKEGGVAFDDDDTHLLQHVGLYASSIIENADLYKKIKLAHEDVVFRLSHATKLKDPETQNHIIRVGLYCKALAAHLGWSDELQEIIRLAAPMHDIGKVGVPDNILLKKGPLDETEWGVMKQHTVFGHEILYGGESLLLEVAADIALEHHERWNGSGYPFGKREQDISIYGRMTAIADVFDALTSRRSYKEVWPLERVREEMDRQAGKHFDPVLTDIFLRNFDEMVAIRGEYED